MRPSDRNKAAVKTQDKPGEKRMVCVARGYSVDPHVRSAETIVESFFKSNGSDKEKQSSRPKPRYRRMVASLKRSKSEVFAKSERGVKSRIHEQTREKVVMMDGEKALWNLSRDRFHDWTEILDFCHVLEKLRIAGRLHYGEEGDGAKSYVRERSMLLLEGEVDLVIEGMAASLEDGSLSKTKAK